jgi:hypothetical protein
VAPGDGAPLAPPPPSIPVGAVGRGFVEVADVEVELPVVVPLVDELPEPVAPGGGNATVVVKTNVRVPVVSCLSGRTETKVDNEVDTITVCDALCEFGGRVDCALL